MKEVLDGGALAKEFWIGDDPECQAVIARVGVQGSTELEAGASGNGTFLDDEFRRTCFAGDLAGDIVDGRKIGVAVFLWRRANADEDGVAPSNCFTGIG